MGIGFGGFKDCERRGDDQDKGGDQEKRPSLSHLIALENVT